MRRGKPSPFPTCVFIVSTVQLEPDGAHVPCGDLACGYFVCDNGDRAPICRDHAIIVPADRVEPLLRLVAG